MPRSLAAQNRIFYSLSTESLSLRCATYKRRTKRCPFKDTLGDRETSKLIELGQRTAFSGKLLSAVKSTFCSPLFQRDNALMLAFMSPKYRFPYVTSNISRVYETISIRCFPMFTQLIGSFAPELFVRRPDFLFEA